MVWVWSYHSLEIGWQLPIPKELHSSAQYFNIDSAEQNKMNETRGAWMITYCLWSYKGDECQGCILSLFIQTLQMSSHTIYCILCRYFRLQNVALVKTQVQSWRITALSFVQGHKNRQILNPINSRKMLIIPRYDCMFYLLVCSFILLIPFITKVLNLVPSEKWFINITCYVSYKYKNKFI